MTIRLIHNTTQEQEVAQDDTASVLQWLSWLVSQVLVYY